MSTRLSAEELDAIEARSLPDGVFGSGVSGPRSLTQKLTAEIRASWAESVRLRAQLGEVANAAMGLPFDHPVRVVLTKYAAEKLEDSARTFDDEHDGSVLRVGVVGERTMEQECDSLEAEALKDGEFVGITNGLALRLVSECRESVRLREALESLVDAVDDFEERGLTLPLGASMKAARALLESETP